MHSSAISLAEDLINITDVNPSDIILYATCFFRGNEFRRCLAALEQRSMLSAEIMQQVSNAITTAKGNSNNVWPNCETIPCYITGILLAAQSLFQLEQYEDCLILLESM